MFELIIPFITTIPYPDEESEKYDGNIKLFEKDEKAFFKARKLEAKIIAEDFLNEHWIGEFYIEEINFGEKDEYPLDDAMRIIFFKERV
jgi:hypothetical protein